MEMRTLAEHDKILEDLWAEFGDIPMDPDTEEMEGRFLDGLCANYLQAIGFNETEK